VRRFLEQHQKVKNSPTGLPNCSSVADSLQSQYAETPEGIDPSLISDDVYLISDNRKYSLQEFAKSIRQKYPKAYDDVSDEQLARAVIEKYPVYKGQVRWNPLQEEWEHIRAKPDFVKLSESKKRLVKNAFWVRRADPADSPDNVQQLDKLWLTVFQDEIARGLVPAKRDSDYFSKQWTTEVRLRQGIVVENADPDGHFSLTLTRGRYLLIVEGKVLKPFFLGKNNLRFDSWEPAVWVKTIQVPRDNGIVISEPFCEP
jgi:hypothetical protein